MILPLFAMRGTVPRMVKVALAGYFAYLVFPSLSAQTSFFAKSYNLYFDYDGSFTLEYIMLLVGEGLIGIIMGLYVSMIFAAFSTAGQFFAFQTQLLIHLYQSQ